MDDRERQQALEDAIRGAVASQAEIATAHRAPVRGPRSQAPLIATIAMGWAAIAWIWTTRPAIIFGSDAPPVLSAEQREATLRYAMYLQHADVTAFARDSGRAPRSLNELENGAAEGVTLQPGDSGRWVLVGLNQDLELRLTSTMSPDSFLGSSLTILGSPR